MYQAQPTAEELQVLDESFRRDPAAHYAALGNCLLALGRPADAAAVATQGLRYVPDDLGGHLLLGVAHSQLHQWKESQAELLKVVKADRGNVHGFRLLGEVLLRRNDFERALPVLQHAQNLNPSDSGILALVRYARDRQPLDPPAPIPQPISPAQRPSLPAAAIPQSAMMEDDDDPTFAIGHASEMAPSSAGFSPSLPQARANPMPPASANPMPPAPRQQRSSAPPPPPSKPSGAPVRPRVISAEKPKDAALEGLRGSAAVGEQYLNNLLLGGLLDLPNVRVTEANFDSSPGKRWGRSSGRMFIYLFVILLSAGAGSGVWYWYSGKQMRADVARYLDSARELVDTGDQQDLEEAMKQVDLAIKRDSSDPYTIAVTAEVMGLSGVLYGSYPPMDIERAIKAVEKDIQKPGDSGYRELVVARASLTLYELHTMEEGGDARLASTMAQLQEWLGRSPEDHLARWLLGRCVLAAGNRSDAETQFTKAHANGAGAVMGTIDLANFYLDGGEYEKAMTLFENALARSQNHPLAFVGRSLARSERRLDPDAAIADINIGLARASGLTLLAWKELATASAQLALQDYEAFDKALGKATESKRPSFLARVGLGRIVQGRVTEAAALRSEILWFAADPQPNPLVTLLDAELLLARGLPNDALDALGDASGLRSLSIRGRAYFDLNKMAKALEEFESALKLAPDDIDLMAWTEASRMMATRGDSRRKADEALDSIGRRATSKTPRFVHGKALAAIGKRQVAKDKLLLSITDMSVASPNALAYRSYLELAQIAFSEKKQEDALDFLDKAAKSNPGYLPINDVYGQILLASDPAKAMQYLSDVQESGSASAGAEIAYAIGLINTGGSKADASDAIRRAKEKGAAKEALQEAIAKVNPSLFDELGLTAQDSEEVVAP